jgi:CheY-like chemotaxis protein
MDAMMPGMGGIAAARAILGRHRGVVVFLISSRSELTRLWETHP